MLRLTSEAASYCSDIMLDESINDKYMRIKERLIFTYEVSPEKRLRQLLNRQTIANITSMT